MPPPPRAAAFAPAPPLPCADLPNRFALPRPRLRQRPVLTCSRATDVAAAAAAAITVGLSCLPLSPLVPRPAMAHVASAPCPFPSLVVRHPAHTTPSSSSGETPPTVAVIGVAKAPIQDYYFDPSVSAPVPVRASSPVPTSAPAPVTDVADAGAENQALLEAAAEDARREFVLAARLVTAVLLGVMVGVERRATALNMGVRSITIVTLSAALVASVCTCAQGVGAAALLPGVAAAPAASVLGAGATAGLALYAAARARTRPPREMVSMCVVVALAVSMGAACGAGLSLVTAGCYLAAISVMRATESRRRQGSVAVGSSKRKVEGGYVDEVVEVEEDDDVSDADESWDDEDQMVVRIRTGRNGRRTRVVEMRGLVQDEGVDVEGSDFAL